eukprot:98522_1
MMSNDSTKDLNNTQQLEKYENELRKLQSYTTYLENIISSSNVQYTSITDKFFENNLVNEWFNVNGRAIIRNARTNSEYCSVFGTNSYKKGIISLNIRIKKSQNCYIGICEHNIDNDDYLTYVGFRQHSFGYHCDGTVSINGIIINKTKSYKSGDIITIIINFPFNKIIFLINMIHYGIQYDLTLIQKRHIKRVTCSECQGFGGSGYGRCMSCGGTGTAAGTGIDSYTYRQQICYKYGISSNETNDEFELVDFNETLIKGYANINNIQLDKDMFGTLRKFLGDIVNISCKEFCYFSVMNDIK